MQYPQKYLVDRCIKRLWPSVLAATREGSDPDDARLVYDDAKVLIGSETYAALVSQAHISINGAWIEGRVTLLTAVDLLNGALLVVKVGFPFCTGGHFGGRDHAVLNLLKSS